VTEAVMNIDGPEVWLGLERQRIYTEFYCENLLENIHLEDRKGNGRILSR
jgi:hypothetical protein